MSGTTAHTQRRKKKLRNIFTKFPPKLTDFLFEVNVFTEVMLGYRDLHVDLIITACNMHTS